MTVEHDSLRPTGAKQKVRRSEYDRNIGNCRNLPEVPETGDMTY